MILNLTKPELECLRRCVWKQAGDGVASFVCRPLIDALLEKIVSLQRSNEPRRDKNDYSKRIA